MSSQRFVAIELDADFGGTVGEVTGRFEFPRGTDGAFSAEQAVRTGYILNSSFDTLAALLTALASDAGETDRKGLHFDVGGGEHAVTFQFQTPGKQTTPDDGTVAQWGSSANPADGPNRHTATGETDQLIQMQVLLEYFRVGTFDSLNPARVTYGQYNPDGFLDNYLAVAVEEPSVLVDNRDVLGDGSMTFVETADLNDGGDEQFLEDSG